MIKPETIVPPSPHRHVLHRLWRAIVPTLACAAALLAGCGQKEHTTNGNLNAINHIVVIYLENHSFDNLYGEFPGANGLFSATWGISGAQWSATHPQIDTATGMPFLVLPQPMNTEVSPNVPDALFPVSLPNAPFAMENYVGTSEDIPDLLHRYYQEQMEIHDGNMDKYATIEDAKGLAMGYWHTQRLLLAKFANEFTLCDNFFHSVFGGSFINHQWLIAARTPSWRNVPAGAKAVLGADGTLVKDGFADPDGNLINTCYSQNAPHPATAPPELLIPNAALTNATIGDEMTTAGVSWAWYSGGWADALAGHPGQAFQYHHQPFNYYANFSDSTTAGRANKAKYLLDETEFISAANAGTLPQVSFVKPYGLDNEHPGYADLYTGELHVDLLIHMLMKSPNYDSMLIIVTYDEHGGQWDHVAPPAGDKWGPGTRVPTILIGPYVKKGYVDHTQYETLSILSLIEKRFGLGTLGIAPHNERNAVPFTNAFIF